MSYKLEKPCSEKQRADFIVMYNHRLGLDIHETKNTIFALDKNEVIDETSGLPITNKNYEQEKFDNRKVFFERLFFKTSYGWVERNVHTKNCAEKDFLYDCLLPIKACSEKGLKLKIKTYSTPDFNQELSKEYLESLAGEIIADEKFITECLEQVIRDIGGYNE